MGIHIGGHMSIAGGFYKALERVHAIGGNALQIFSASPRGWNAIQAADADIERFVTIKQKLGIQPVYFHASYLINLADGAETGRKSQEKLIEEMRLQPLMQVSGSVVHLGSYKTKKTEQYEIFPSKSAFSILIEHMREVLRETPSDSVLLIENAASRKIGRTLEEIAHIMDTLGDKRVRVCLDTCHLHAAGYDLRTPDTFAAFWEKFDALIGIQNLEVLHVNDSKDSLGSMRDRHENLGKGQVGESVFTQLATNPRTQDIPFILEVPGLDGEGPDKANVDIFKQYAQV